VREHNLWEIFASVARACPDRDAIIWRERTVTYAGLADQATRLANLLTHAGLGSHRGRAGLKPWEPGQDLAALYLLNGPEYLVATLACYAARVAPFNVNYRYVPAEITRLFRDANPAAVIYHQRYAPALGAALRGTGQRPVLLQVPDGSGHEPADGAVDYHAAIGAQPGALAVRGHSPDDLYVLYTGGTTGSPKATLWRHADIWLAALGGETQPEATLGELAQAAAGGPPRRIVPNAPFMHGAAHWMALRALLSGGCVIVNSVVDHLEPADVWRTIEAHRADTTLFVGDAFARPLLDELQATAYDVTALRAIVVGGAFTSPATKQRILRLIPRAIVVDLAGATETGSALRQVSAAGRPSSGRIFSSSPAVAVLDPQRRGPLAPGHEGTGWLAKSGRIPLGYLNDPARTASTFPEIGGERWSVPGDRARLLADGSIELLGRDAQTINSLGEKIFAEEVEQAIAAHPDVQDVIVVGRPSARWGQEVVAIVAVRAGVAVTDAEITGRAAALLARYKLPKAIIRVPAVRRSPAGKADYRWAAGLAGAGDG
jgi:3-oxocholest-4-en-26-oate---CoA ligase